MNTGSQGTTQPNEFSMPNVSCAIPQQTPDILDHYKDWKTYTFRNAAAPIYTVVVEELEKSAICSMLRANINALQEIFLEGVHRTFRRHDVDTQQKITLGLDDENLLHMCNAHSDKSKIQLLLHNEEELSSIFTEIYIQSLALREITLLQQLTCLYLTNQQERVQGSPSYRVNVKGDMSHFFFITI